jgi:uncharacterized protein (DUF1330 family)
MAKGYWIPHIDVSDPEGYKAYMAATPPAHDKYRGRALVRGGAQEVVEGKSRSRNVLREFPDYATEPEGYKAYMTADMAAFGKYGGCFLVRGGQQEVVEGKARGRTVVLEFPSYRVALDCYRSPEYQAAAALRKGKAEFDLFIIEGCDAQS